MALENCCSNQKIMIANSLNDSNSLYFGHNSSILAINKFMEDRISFTVNNAVPTSIDGDVPKLVDYSDTDSETESVIAENVQSSFQGTVTSGSLSSETSNEEINSRGKRQKNKKENDRKKLQVLGKTYLNYRNQKIEKKITSKSMQWKIMF